MKQFTMQPTNLNVGRREASWLSQLQVGSEHFPERLAFQYLGDQDDASVISYGQLDQAARRIAASLQDLFEPGQSVLLVFPPGLEFIKTFLGCAYAGILAIPATYPKLKRPSPRLSAIVREADPAAILSTNRVVDHVADSPMAQGLGNRTWLSIERLESSAASAWQPTAMKSTDLCFLQYTSGSTSDPRGVEISHGNITSNLEMIRQGFGLSRAHANVGVCWLPAYHDMGLIGGILESIYVGGTTIMMSPLSFLQRPVNWLRAISEYGAIVSGGPNFAYELCLRKIQPNELEGLDLSSWRVAFSGSEPIRSATMRRFAEKFAVCGFSDSAFYPCYGLAEATLFVTGGAGPAKIETCNILADKFQSDGVAVDADTASSADTPTLEFVNCGSPLLDEQVLIVDPDTNVACDESVVGEIWVSGKNVARGYRNRAEENRATFHAQLAGSFDDSFLRTGDLGFIRNGSLFVTGRRKGVLIIRGRNHYPHDLEASAQSVHDRLVPGGGAAFLVEDRNKPASGEVPPEDHLVIVQEVDRMASKSDCESMLSEIRRRVTGDHDVFVHEVVLIRMGTLPRTTSGKVRYDDVRQNYSEQELSMLCRWCFGQSGPRSAVSSSDGGRNGKTYQPADLTQLLRLPKIDDPQELSGEIQSRLMKWLSQSAAGQDAAGQSAAEPDAAGRQSDFDPNRPLSDYGLDSLASMELIAQFEQGLGIKLSPTIAWSYPTPVLLSRYLADRVITESMSGTASVSAETSQPPASQLSLVDPLDQLLSQLEEMPDDEAAALLADQISQERDQ